MTQFQSDTDQLLFAVDQRVAMITLNRPQARNALSDELTSAMRRAIAWSTQSPEVGAVLVTGAGSAFCSGGDVKAMGSRPAPADPDTQLTDMLARHHEIAGALHAMAKPSIAALPGAAAGAGMAIALSCDFRIAAESAFLTTAYAKIGLSGDYGIAWLLSRVVGPGRARALMLTADRVSANDACNIGLVNQVVADNELARSSRDLATRLANGPQQAYALIKDNLNEALSIDHATAIDHEAERLIQARKTSDHKEAVRAFAEKRPPKFGS
jgi:2-(1,2-epoxy-1,2-dihydrophenyl)acetyl-CoA isomerase